MHEERCLNRRHRSEFCHTCRDTCPQNAIDISGLSIRVDTTKCDLCALCITDCPTEVFTHKDFSPLDFLAEIKGRQTLDLHCKFMDSRESRRGHVRLPCHGLLDDRLLTGLHTVGVEHVYLHGTSQCDACPSRVGSSRLSKTINYASPEMQRNFPCIHMDCDDESASPLTEAEPSSQHPGTPVTRRGFLDKMLEVSSQTAAFATMGVLLFNPAEDPSVKTPEAAPVPEQNEITRKHIPQSHRLALFSLASVQASESSSASACSWFHEIHPQGVCDACGICALQCPTGSLLIEASEEMLEVKHQPAACIGCGLCVSLCPTQALRLDAVDNDILFTEAPVTTLFQCRQSICSACGQLFTYSGSGRNICHSCENEKRIEHDIFGQDGHFRPIKQGR